MSSQHITPGQVNPAAKIVRPTSCSFWLARVLNASMRVCGRLAWRSRQSVGSSASNIRRSPQ